MNLPMDSKSILITGSSEGGIGHTAALVLKERGYRVFATARQLKDVEKLRAEGFESCLLDLTQPDTIDSALQWVLARTGGTLYALFNNGGFGQPGALEDITTDVLKAQFETNFFGWHELVRRVVPIMREQGYGRIIQHGSILGLISLKFRGPYNASKYAIEGYTDTLRLELTDSNIYATVLNTGPVSSRFRVNAQEAFQKNVNQEDSFFKEVYARSMKKRFENPDKKDPFQLEADAVVKKLIHALESKRPKPRYYVTFPSYLLSTVKRLLPTNLLDRLLVRISDS